MLSSPDNMAFCRKPRLRSPIIQEPVCVDLSERIVRGHTASFTPVVEPCGREGLLHSGCRSRAFGFPIIMHSNRNEKKLSPANGGVFPIRSDRLCLGGQYHQTLSDCNESDLPAKGIFSMLQAGTPRQQFVGRRKGHPSSLAGMTAIVFGTAHGPALIGPQAGDVARWSGSNVYYQHSCL